MAIADEKAFAPRYTNGHRPRVEFQEVPRVFEFWRLVKRRWKVAVVAGVVAGLVVLFWTELIAVPLYRAEAIIKPSQDEGASVGLAMNGSSALEALTGAGVGQSDATEFQKILESYQFTMLMVRHFHIDVTAREDRSWLSRFRHPVLTDYMIYNEVKDNFHSDYDSYAGIVTLSYAASSQQRAEAILQFYIDNLRELLSKRNFDRSRVAARAIMAEAYRTSDVVLQNALEMLAAQQTQNATLSAAQADYAFKVLSPPVADDRPNSPKPLLDTILAGVLGFIAAALWIAIVRPLYDWYDNYEKIVARNGYLPLDHNPVVRTESDELTNEDRSFVG
jgi:LPS O-antigen subunit length determinant protein (WzzB/FepE family)